MYPQLLIGKYAAEVHQRIGRTGKIFQELEEVQKFINNFHLAGVFEDEKEIYIADFGNIPSDHQLLIARFGCDYRIPLVCLSMVDTFSRHILSYFPVVKKEPPHPLSKDTKVHSMKMVYIESENDPYITRRIKWLKAPFLFMFHRRLHGKESFVQFFLR